MIWIFLVFKYFYHADHASYCFLWHTPVPYYMQKNYVNMQRIYAHMRPIYVNMQHNYMPLYM